MSFKYRYSLAYLCDGGHRIVDSFFAASVVEAFLMANKCHERRMWTECQDDCEFVVLNRFDQEVTHP
jgi:hypothetical protein